MTRRKPLYFSNYEFETLADLIDMPINRVSVKPLLDFLRKQKCQNCECVRDVKIDSSIVQKEKKEGVL